MEEDPCDSESEVRAETKLGQFDCRWEEEVHPWKEKGRNERNINGRMKGNGNKRTAVVR